MRRKGFTLVELLAVIAILALLVIITLPNVLSLFNNSKKNAFLVQARNTANVVQEQLFTSNDKTFDCNKILTGQKFKECDAALDNNNQLSVDLVGSGAFENFVMFDVTPNPSSGTFADLSNLKVLDVGNEKDFSESFIENNKINEPVFKIMTADEAINIESSLYDLSSSEKQQMKEEYNSYSSYLKINNNIINNTYSNSVPLYVKIVLPAGEYEMVFKYNDFNSNELIYNDDVITRYDDIDSTEEYYNSIFSKYNADSEKFTGTINIDKETTYYLAGYLNSGDKGPEITIKSQSSIKYNSDENIVLYPEEVSTYKDDGITYNGSNLSDSEFYTYSNLKDKEGIYKLIYAVKTNQGIKLYKKNVTVTNITSENCFKFNTETQEIEQYYYLENNVSSGNKCPMDVVIPNKISNVEVKSIGNTAFNCGCTSTVVKPTSSNMKYEINKIACFVYPIGIKSIILPEGLEYIGYEAFKDNNLSTVTIPSKVNHIGYGAFKNNELQNVTFNGDKNKINIQCEAFKGSKHSSSVNSIVEDCK